MQTSGQRRHAAWVDIAVSLVLLAACGIGAWSLAGNRVLYDFDYGADPGPGLVPGLLLAALALCSIGLMGWALFRLWLIRGQAGAVHETGGLKRIAMPAAMTVCLIAYARTLVDLGFLETTITFTAVWCILIGLQEDGRPSAARLALYAAEAVAITGGIYLVFAKLIQVPLP
jgi:hypothetical protein